MALAHTERMRTVRKNNLIVRCYEKEMDLSDFFHSDSSIWKETFELSDEETEWLQAAKAELPNYSFLAEDLLEQGYDMIPITSSDYPKALKVNLKKTYAPPLIYIKGLHSHCRFTPSRKHFFDFYRQHSTPGSTRG